MSGLQLRGVRKSFGTLEVIKGVVEPFVGRVGQGEALLPGRGRRQSREDLGVERVEEVTGHGLIPPRSRVTGRAAGDPADDP